MAFAALLEVPGTTRGWVSLRWASFRVLVLLEVPGTHLGWVSLRWASFRVLVLLEVPGTHLGWVSLRWASFRVLVLFEVPGTHLGWVSLRWATFRVLVLLEVPGTHLGWVSLRWASFRVLALLEVPGTTRGRVSLRWASFRVLVLLKVPGTHLGWVSLRWVSFRVLVLLEVTGTTRGWVSVRWTSSRVSAVLSPLSGFSELKQLLDRSAEIYVLLNIDALSTVMQDITLPLLLLLPLPLPLPLPLSLLNSLLTGVVTPYMKLAHITPIIKNSSRDKSNLSNYHPISNLSFISKTLERVIAAQLNNYLINNNILNKFQSAYTNNKNTETALTHILNNILLYPTKYCSSIVLLDLTAAFDTIDHNIMIRQLQCIGLSSTALEWFISYLDSRSYSIRIESHLTKPRLISNGVPQGSVLAPILFNIYLSPLLDIFDKYPDINFHVYADDIQIYCNLPDPSLNISTLNKCLEEIRYWLAVNLLALNSEKTTTILIKISHTLHYVMLYMCYTTPPYVNA